MTNFEIWLRAFRRQFPQFSNADITMNLYGDIMDLNARTRKLTPFGFIEGYEIVATSNISHDLEKVGFSVPTSWTLTEYGKKYKPTI